MYCSAITMRLLVGRLTPAMRAKLVTPQASYSLRRAAPGRPLGLAACHRFQCHLKGHKHKKTTPACRSGLASLLNLRLDIPGLLMDSKRFRQPRLAISCTDSVSGGGYPHFCASAGPVWRPFDAAAPPGHALRTFFLYTPSSACRRHHRFGAISGV